MDPKEFGWEADQQVTVTNPTAEDFVFKVHAKEYKVGSGQTVKMPGYIAWVYAYHLASKLVQADGLFNRWNEEGFRKTYYAQLVIGAEDVVQAVQPEPNIEDFDNSEPEQDDGLEEVEANEPTEEPESIEPMETRRRKRFARNK